MTEHRPQQPGERTDRYIRTTGYLPPHWSARRRRSWHNKHSFYVGLVIGFYAPVRLNDVALAQRWLAAYGLGS
uniref:Integrase n=1 Tax=Streptomyces sp. NBC_00049 TaxID=2903617 RepID=A0AAU2JMH2_9ACTN